MFKRLILLCLMLTLVVFGVSAQSETTPYLAAAYLPDDGKVLLMDETSVTAEIVLPLPDGFDRNASTVAMLNSQLAYIARKEGATDKALTLASLSDSGTEIAISASISLRTDAAYTSFFLRAPATFGLRDGATHLVVGYGLDPLGWELLIVDESLNTVANLSQDALPDQPKDYGFTPYPIHFRPDGTVAFALIDAQAEGVQTPQVFIWNTFTNEVTPTNAYNLDGDIYTQSGEVISVKNGGLQWFDSYTGEFARFYVPAAGGETLSQPRFASHAGVIVVRKDGKLLSVGRDGSEFETLPNSETATDWYGLNDGLVITFNSEEAVTLARIKFSEVIPTDSSAYQTLTTLPADTTVHWVASDMRVGIVTPEYIDWASVDGAGTESVVVAGVSPIGETVEAEATAVVESIAAEGLFTGGWATTFTDDGDQLNVRAGAGTGFEVLTRVNPGILVQLVEGPVEADDLVWWRVVFPTGSDGWLVQSVEDVQTLQPAEAPPTPTPTPVPAVVPTQSTTIVLSEISSFGSAGSSLVDVTFSWSSLPGAAKYQLEVLYCNDGVNCTPGFVDDTVRTTFNASFSINNPTLPIRWRVLGLNNAGSVIFQTEYKDSIVAR